MHTSPRAAIACIAGTYAALMTFTTWSVPNVAEVPRHTRSSSCLVFSPRCVSLRRVRTHVFMCFTPYDRNSLPGFQPCDSQPPHARYFIGTEEYVGVCRHDCKSACVPAGKQQQQQQLAMLQAMSMPCDVNTTQTKHCFVVVHN
ncbi:hypothetical protein V8C86DRAFT_1064154 [Haematococcus lacustris]